jgi:MYXO-CTERM domain-containing protein
VRRAAVSVSVAAFVACSPSAQPTGVTSEAVTNAASDDGDPAVVALVESNVVMCSGTLISPHVVLTAAHCGIDDTTFTQYQAYFGSSPASGGTFVSLSAALVHPGFDPSTLADDLALVVLASDVSAAPVPMLPSSGDSIAAGATMRVAGFGSSGDGGGNVKRSGNASVSGITSTTIGLVPGPSLPCEGDSGGPGFFTVGTTEYLAGVTSNGDAACVAQTTDTRVDAYESSFIQPYLASIGEGTAQPGERCLFPEQCAASTCVVAGDDPNIAYCAPPCTTSATCPANTVCTPGDGGSLCLYPLPTPGAIGSSCMQPSDCVGSQCISTGVCSVRCVSGENDCPSGFDCENTSGIDFYCTATPAPAPSKRGGGCSCAVPASGEGAGAWWTLAGLLVANRAQRRRRPP